MNQVFKIGEKVVSLSNPTKKRSQPRQKGGLYTVRAISYCSGCGVQSINIGPKSDATLVRCGCGSVQPNKGLFWTDSIHFVRPKEISEAITHFEKKEEYETCEVLKKFEEQNTVLNEKPLNQ